MPFEQFISPDGLHMNDWGYGCIGQAARRRSAGRREAAGRDRRGAPTAALEALIRSSSPPHTLSSAASRSSTHVVGMLEPA